MGIPYQSKNLNSKKAVKKINCLNCDGTKINPEKPEEKCPDCNGEGQIEITV